MSPFLLSSTSLSCRRYLAHIAVTVSDFSAVDHSLWRARALEMLNDSWDQSRGQGKGRGMEEEADNHGDLHRPSPLQARLHPQPYALPCTVLVLFDNIDGNSFNIYASVYPTVIQLHRTWITSVDITFQNLRFYFIRESVLLNHEIHRRFQYLFSSEK